jgi:hypothetical protein
MFIYVGYYSCEKRIFVMKEKTLKTICDSNSQKTLMSININSWSKYFDNHSQTAAT